MSMVHVILIDDEPLARSLLREYLAAFPDVEIVAECNDGFEGLKAIREFRPDLIFLDIQMPKISGFEMLELLNEPPAVIFTTAFDEHALKAFEANAVDYLLKPYSRERFARALEKWLLNYRNNHAAPPLPQNLPARPEESSRIVVKTAKGVRIIPVKDVFYFEAYDDYVKFYTAEGMFLRKKTLSFFEEILDPAEFVRVHRSYIAAVQSIVKIEQPDKDSHTLVLKNGVKIPVSRQGYGRLKSVLGL